MRAALHGSYVEFVIYMGMTEKYPLWFKRELDECAYTDESRFTFWVDKDERRPDYYEKQLIEEFSVIIRKTNGEIYVTDYDVFQNLYITFRMDWFTNSGLAAFEEDCIEYVECIGGILKDAYPEWFYEYFTESINFPHVDETIFFHQTPSDNVVLNVKENDVEISVTEHCVFLRNKLGEIRSMTFQDFMKYYDHDPDPEPIIWAAEHDGVVFRR